MLAKFRFNKGAILNLKSISDQDILNATKNLARTERNILNKILHHLKEIDRRRLYSQLKCKSLLHYCTQELNYSEDQAYRRIKAMKLLKEFPEIEEKIANGSLHLGHLTLASQMFRAEARAGQPRAHKSKFEVISAMENKNRREAEMTIRKMATVPLEQLKPESRRAIGNSIELRFTISHDLEQKIEKVKGLWAHKCPHMTTAQLIEKFCDLAIVNHEKDLARAEIRVAQSKSSASRSIPSNLRRQIWKRDNSKCTNCGSKYALQVDHIVPVAMGGDSSPENLRLLCRSCNQRSAINVFGVDKMSNHMDSPRKNQKNSNQ